jgi:hypothetical protein
MPRRPSLLSVKPSFGSFVDMFFLISKISPSSYALTSPQDIPRVRSLLKYRSSRRSFRRRHRPARRRLARSFVIVGTGCSRFGWCPGRSLDRVWIRIEFVEVGHLFLAVVADADLPAIGDLRRRLLRLVGLLVARKYPITSVNPRAFT